MLHYFVQLIVLLKECINTQFILYPKVYQQRTREPRGEAEQVDKKCTLESFEIPVNKKQIMTQHSSMKYSDYAHTTGNRALQCDL
jgi:hypothetical protein